MNSKKNPFLELLAHSATSSAVLVAIFLIAVGLDLLSNMAALVGASPTTARLFGLMAHGLLYVDIGAFCFLLVIGLYKFLRSAVKQIGSA